MVDNCNENCKIIVVYKRLEKLKSYVPKYIITIIINTNIII